MYGVVLWSDTDCDRALIWCEDHGHLAFYNGPSEALGSLDEIEAGDLVQVTVEEAQDFRIAKDIKLVATDEYPQLVDTLRQASEQPKVRASASHTSPSNIVPFAPKKTTRLKRNLRETKAL